MYDIFKSFKNISSFRTHSIYQDYNSLVIVDIEVLTQIILQEKLPLIVVTHQYLQISLHQRTVFRIDPNTQLPS